MNKPDTMKNQRGCLSEGAKEMTYFSLFIFSVSVVQLAYWCFSVSLPTLVFIAFVLLFIGGFFCYPFVPSSGDIATAQANYHPRFAVVLLLIVGWFGGLSVLILFGVRLY